MDMPTAREQIASLQARKVSASELVARAIARIEAKDGAINAVVVRDFERARAAALEADKALKGGDQRPLLGLPITVKECFDVAGLPKTWGIPGTEKIPVVADSVVVARLKSAGAIVLGKTNIAQHLADWQSFNPLYGATNNPWDLARTPGGSSGGSAAALAAGYVALEFGSDINSSLRIPAAFCGVFAHKPSWNLIPGRGMGPPGTPALLGGDVDLAVAGPMARSAEDLALALAVTAGPDADKAVGYKLALRLPRHEQLSDYRVLVLDNHPLLPIANDVRSALDRVARNLGKAGAKVARESKLVPDLVSVSTVFGQLFTWFMGGEMQHSAWMEADRARLGIAQQWRELFKAFDVVLCPAAPTTAFKHDRREMAARRLSVDGKDIPYTDQAQWGVLATLCGLPATVMPIGLGADGLPVGMQVIGPSLEDYTTIGFAALAEREFGGFIAPKIA